jgi:hypothetical protein
VLIDRENWHLHRAWVVFTVLATIAAIAWYVVVARASNTLPGGSSLPGFSFGVVGGVIILFELLLWVRKKLRVWRIGRAQVWMRAHIWLGLLCFPVLVLHSGLRLGGTLSTVLMVLLVIVILSGIWGLILQNRLPRRMLNEVPAETIYSQIDYVAAQFLAEARHLVRATCGPRKDEPSEAKEIELAQAELKDPGSHRVVGAVRYVGLVAGKVLQTEAPRVPVVGSEPLRDFFDDTVAPFLTNGGARRSPLLVPNRAAAMFQDLKTRLPPEARAAADSLEVFCTQRRQLDAEARIHVWLHNWLWIHFPVSVALVVLMFVHVWVAVKYW